jgi:hypothetical protein
LVTLQQQRRFCFAAVFLLCGAVLSAQKFTLTLSTDTITTDDQFVVYLEGEMNNFSSYATLPDVPGLVTVSHTESFNYNSSTKAATVRQSYTMKAINSGDYTIGAAWIQSGSRRLYSNTVHLHVNAGDNPVSNGMVFMRFIPAKSTVYAGEKVRASLYLYYSPEYTVSGDYPVATSYSGFWSEADADYSRNYNDTTVYINGKRFYRRTIYSEYLFPNAIGTVKMPEYTYSCYLTKYDEDVYSWDSYDMSFDLVSEPSTITVLDLPKHDSLPGFAGDVGQYKMTCKVSADTTKCWEPITVTMFITGTGNFQFMMTPQLSMPPGFRAQNILAQDSSTYEYDYYDNYDYKATETGKLYRYLITPEKEGDFHLPGISFSYFDPKKKEYVTLQSDSFRLHVAPGDTIQSETVNNLPDSFFEKKGKKEESATIVFVCIALLLVPVGAFVFYRYKRKQRLKKEAEEKEAARLAKLAENAEYVPPPDTTIEQANGLVHGAGQYLQTGMVVPAVNNLYEALVIRITGFAKMRREEISVNSLRYKLRMAKTDPALIDSLIEQYEDLMLKRYTISPADTAAVHVLIVRTADLIRKLR